MAKKKKGGRVTPKGRSTQAQAAFAQILGVAHEDLSEIENPIDAEVLASALISGWRNAVDDDSAGIDADEVVGLGLVLQATRSRLPTMLVLLRAIAAVGPPRLAQAASTAAFARDARDVSQYRPAWLDLLGTARPVGAWRVWERWLDAEVAGIAFTYGDGGPVHSINVVIDRIGPGIARDGFVSGDLADVLTAYRDEDGWTVEEAIIAEVADDIDEALAVAQDRAAEPTDDLVEVIPLIEARLDALAEEEGSLGPVDLTGSGSPIDEDDLGPVLEDLIDATLAGALAHIAGFLSSPEGEVFLDEPSSERAVSDIVMFRAIVLGGDALHVSPAVVSTFLMRFYATEVMAAEDVYAVVPDVVGAWVRYACRLRNREGFVDELLETLEELRQPFLDACADPKAWGPGKRAAHDGGVDFSDEAALRAWNGVPDPDDTNYEMLEELSGQDREG